MEQNSLRQMVATALMTAVLCVLGPVMVPLGPIPFSLQVFTIYLTVYLLGMKRGTVATVLYLLIGFVGLPVFTGFSGGAAKIIGPTGGFLVGFVPLALISGWVVDHFRGRVAVQFIGMFIGLVVLYAFGTAWLINIAHLPLEKALKAAVYPFVAIDTVKLVLAIVLGRIVRKRVKF